jgi:gamma-glutamylaminecyclotransferase
MASLLFLYGTLKRGQANHHLLAGQRFLGEAVTSPFYRLFNKGPHPCLVKSEQGGVAIHGELWSVDEDTLVRLDAFEDAPYGFIRAPIDIAGFIHPVEAYFYAGDVRELAPAGNRWP